MGRFGSCQKFESSVGYQPVPLANAPATLRSQPRSGPLIGRLTDLGCETQLLRRLNVYVDDGLGGRVCILSIAPGGTVEVWGVASRDTRLGEPMGRNYMAHVSALLPGGQLKDDFPNPLRGTSRSMAR